MRLTYNLCFDFMAFAILVTTLFYFGAKSKVSLRVYRLYSIIILTVIGMTALDILTVVYRIFPGVATPRMVTVINVINLGMQYYLAPLYTVYLLATAQVEGGPSRRWKLAIYLPYSLLFVVICVYAALGYAAGAQGHLFRQERSLVVLLLIGLVYYLAISDFIGIYYHRALGTAHAIHIVGLQFFLLLIQGYQLLQPERRMIAFWTSLALVDMIFSVQRPEEIFDGSDAMRRGRLRAAARVDYVHRNPFYVIFVKILDYGMLADSLGQEDADSFLKSVTSYLAGRKLDASVYHVERDILALKVGDCDAREREALLSEIRGRFQEPWRGSGTLESMLAASYVAAYCPEEVESYELFRRLTANLAKTEGEADAVLPVAQLIAEDKDQQMLEAIRRALEEDSFQVYYQPIYSTEKKKIIAAEALIRLFDPVYGFIPPEPMIALAEREGYILRIGEIVFTEVCRFYSENHLDQLGIEYIEVNLSAVQCMQNRLAEEFMGIMRRFNLPNDAINFEITETAAMISNAAVTRNISHFELHGVSLSLDDYGTGYSNISYLYNLPFMLMKIDKSLLWSADTNEKADITLRNTFRMAQKLHMKVVMEGVETEAQIKKLLGLHCDYFQGYYFAKPAKGEDFIDYVKHFTLPEVCA